jgi:hypothetical protein
MVGVVHFLILVGIFLRGYLFVAGRRDAGKKKNTENVGSLILNVK